MWRNFIVHQVGLMQEQARRDGGKEKEGMEEEERSKGRRMKKKKERGKNNEHEKEKETKRKRKKKGGTLKAISPIPTKYPTHPSYLSMPHSLSRPSTRHWLTITPALFCDLFFSLQFEICIQSFKIMAREHSQTRKSIWRTRF